MYFVSEWWFVAGVTGLYDHSAHQCPQVELAGIEVCTVELPGESPPLDSVLQVQFVDPAHRPMILLGGRTRHDSQQNVCGEAGAVRLVPPVSTREGALHDRLRARLRPRLLPLRQEHSYAGKRWEPTVQLLLPKAKSEDPAHHTLICGILNGIPCPHRVCRAVVLTLLDSNLHLQMPSSWQNPYAWQLTISAA